MRELSKSDLQAISGGAARNPLEVGTAILLSPFLAVLLQQQAKAGGVPVPSYFAAIGILVRGALGLD
jgi:bacteriocin-like protein